MPPIGIKLDTTTLDFQNQQTQRWVEQYEISLAIAVLALAVAIGPMDRREHRPPWP